MSQHKKSHRILIAEITTAHGIRGEVVVRAYTDAPEGLAAYGPLMDATGRRNFALTSVRVTNKGVVARVAGVNDRNAAEDLRGTKLYVDRAKLPSTGEAEFYHADLIGLRAVAEDGQALGEIVSVQNFGAGDLLELKPHEGETEFIPFENRWVPSVDLDAGHLVIVRPMAADEDDDAAAPPADEAES